MNELRDLGKSLSNAVMENMGRAVSRAQEQKPLPVDLLENDEAYLAIFDAPGARSSDIQVRVDDRMIEVRIDRFRDFYEGFEMRFPGRGLALDGRVKLPAGEAIDADGASATLQKNGTLEVRVPKTGESTTVEIEDETGEAASTEADDAD
jgi:HSP20 family molecular chaperone IbpA